MSTAPFPNLQLEILLAWRILDQGQSAGYSSHHPFLTTSAESTRLYWKLRRRGNWTISTSPACFSICFPGQPGWYRKYSVWDRHHEGRLLPPTTYLGEEDRLLKQTCSHKTRGTESPVYQNLLLFLEKANPVFWNLASVLFLLKWKRTGNGLYPLRRCNFLNESAEGLSKHFYDLYCFWWTTFPLVRLTVVAFL